ncbi:MAG: SHOCT domain-containing protein [Haloferacaceae archaeon]
MSDTTPRGRSEDRLLRVAVVVVAAVLLLPLLTMAVAMPMMGMMGWGMMGGGGVVPFWGVTAMLVPLVVVVGVGYVLYRGVAGERRGETTDPALAELRLAYARGDLTDEEFEERRDRLGREE